MANEPNNPSIDISALTKILGSDPRQEARPSKDTFLSIVEEINNEKQELARVRAKELLIKTITEVQEFSKLEKQFQRAKADFTKAHNKAMGRLQALANGIPEPKDEEEAKQ